MNRRVEQHSKDLLDHQQRRIEHEIYDWSIEETEDMESDEGDQVYRALYFSRGLDNFMCVIDQDRRLIAVDRNMPIDLIERIDPRPDALQTADIVGG